MKLITNFCDLEQICLGKEGCSVPLDKATSHDACPDVTKALAIQVKCGF